MEKQPPTFTFKIILASEIRRLTVSRETTYEQLQRQLRQLAQDRLPTNPKLTWTDEDGDVITLRTQQDLEECFTFLETASSSKTLRLNVAASEETAAPSASTASTASASASSGDHPASSSEPEKGWKGRRHHQGGEWKGKDWKEKKEGGWHARQSERLSAKLETKVEQLSRKLEKMKTSPDFNPSEFARQVKVLRDSGVEVLPLAEILIARSIIQNTRRNSAAAPAGGKGNHHHGRKWHHHHGTEEEREGGVRPCWEKKLGMLSEKTRSQLEGFRQQGLPSGPIMGLYLELKGKYAGEGLEDDDF